MFNRYSIFFKQETKEFIYPNPTQPISLTRHRGEKDFATLSNASRLQVPWCHRWSATGDDGHPKEKTKKKNRRNLFQMLHMFRMTQQDFLQAKYNIYNIYL